jgi:hypothetical protein
MDIKWCWEKSCIRETWGSFGRALWGVSALAMGGLAILVMSLLSVVSPMKVYPKGEVVPVPTLYVQTVEATEAAKVAYYLPYPGLLPDSPFYVLKAIRDKISLWMTWGEEKKARAELALSDKRIAAAEVLANGGKENLGVTTATKAEKYLESAVGRETKLSAAGVDVKSALLGLEKACNKHEEVLTSLEKRVDENGRKTLMAAEVSTKACSDKVQQALREAK